MTDIQASWNLMYNKHTHTDDIKSCVENYDNFSKTYEAVSKTLGFCLPTTVADLINKEIPKSVLLNPKTTMIDVAVGTGLLAEKLQKHGFCGMIDGVDGSIGMIEKAKEKGFYRNIAQHILLEESPMPMSDCTYDILTCVAALSTGHIHSDMLPEMLRIVKPGGHMIFTVRDNATAAQYVSQLNKIVEHMKSKNLWKEVSMTRVEQYAHNCVSNDPEKDAGPMYSLVFHFIKN